LIGHGVPGSAAFDDPFTREAAPDCVPSNLSLAFLMSMQKNDLTDGAIHSQATIEPIPMMM